MSEKNRQFLIFSMRNLLRECLRTLNQFVFCNLRIGELFSSSKDEPKQTKPK